jgi:hypothetical protein
MKSIGDCSAYPHEFFSHYDAFSYWSKTKIDQLGKDLQIIDLGSRKEINAINSSSSKVTSLVLMDCNDKIS